MNIETLVHDMEVLQDLGDVESAHSQADDMLIKALQLLAKRSKNKDAVTRLITAYEAIDKWYA